MAATWMSWNPVQLTSLDGTRLAGQVRRGSGRWLVLVHDVDDDLDSWTPLLDQVSDQEFSILVFDLRGHGASDGTWEESVAHLDVQAAIMWVRDQGSAKIGLIGAGFACGAVLAAITREPVHAIVLLSPTESAGRGPNRPSTPKLVLVGRSNAPAVLAANRIYQHAIGPTILVDLPDENQGTRLFTGQMADHAVEQTVSFLRSQFA